MTPKEFGAQIRMRRLEQHLELDELADMLWTSSRHLAALEQGDFEEGDEDMIPRLDEVLDSPDWDRLEFDGLHRLIPMADEHELMFLSVRLQLAESGNSEKSLQP